MKTIPSVGKMVIIAGFLLFAGILFFQMTASIGQYDKRAVVHSPLGAWEIGGIWHPTKEDIAGLEVSLEQISHMNAENYPAESTVHIDPNDTFGNTSGLFGAGRGGYTSMRFAVISRQSRTGRGGSLTLPTVGHASGRPFSTPAPGSFYLFGLTVSRDGQCVLRQSHK